MDKVQFTHKKVKVNGVDLHYIQAGSGELVLLWHGFCETWYCWRNVIPELSKKYTVIAPDMRGFGDSGAFGVYRAIFETIDQTEIYLHPDNHLKIPVLGLGGSSSNYLHFFR